MEITEPYLLVGAERSGTTLLRLILDSHPEVSFLEEFEYSVDRIPAQVSETAPTWPDMDSYYRYLERHRIFGTSGFKIDKDLPYPELIESFMRKRQKAKGANTVGATLHYGFDRAPVLWPKAKYINIVRDPRDVAASIVKENWEQNVYDSSIWWKEAVVSWGTLKANLDPERWIEIRYEELISDYALVLKRICEFMEISYTTEMFSYADETDYELPSPSLASDWRKSMIDRDVRLAETQIYELMDEEGYQPRNASLRPLTRLERLRLTTTSVLRRHAKRAAKYGVVVHFCEVASRKFGLTTFEDFFRTRLHRRETSQLRKSWRDGNKYECSAR